MTNLNTYPAALLRRISLKQTTQRKTSTTVRSLAAVAQSVVRESDSPSTTLPLRSSSVSTSLPFISNELSSLKSSLFHLLGSSHPSLDAVAKYYFQAEGKHLRPMLVLLMAQATNGLGGSSWQEIWEQEQQDKRDGITVDESLTSVEGVLNDWNPEQMGQEEEGDMIFAEPYRAGIERPHTSSARNRTRSTVGSASSPFTSLSTPSSSPILSTQSRLASVTEMIHVASLLHDDVIDHSPLRRGAPSAPKQFSDKLSVLSGDFLLGRASVALARLGSNEVVELLSTVISNLVEGEVLQLRSPSSPMTPGVTAPTGPSDEAFELYMRKTYLKTASLMAKSARAAVILGGCGVGKKGEGDWVKDVAYGYGRNIGIAFQVSPSFVSASLYISLSN